MLRGTELLCFFAACCSDDAGVLHPLAMIATTAMAIASQFIDLLIRPPCMFGDLGSGNNWLPSKATPTAHACARI